MSDFISRKALLKELKEYVECVYECDFEDTFCTAEGAQPILNTCKDYGKRKKLLKGR